MWTLPRLNEMIDWSSHKNRLNYGADFLATFVFIIFCIIVARGMFYVFVLILGKTLFGLFVLALLCICFVCYFIGWLFE